MECPGADEEPDLQRSSIGMAGVIATAEIDIAADPPLVWSALTDPAQISAYMFGTTVETQWLPDSPITWRGEFEGQPYEDHGQVLEVEPNRQLTVTHFSPLSHQEDRPENYHRLRYEIDGRDGTTHLTLTQDNNADTQEAERAQATWRAVLAALKDTVENG